jgi:hypothetical protein
MGNVSMLFWSIIKTDSPQFQLKINDTDRLIMKRNILMDWSCKEYENVNSCIMRRFMIIMALRGTR